MLGPQERIGMPFIHKFLHLCNLACDPLEVSLLLSETATQGGLSVGAYFKKHQK